MLIDIILLIAVIIFINIFFKYINNSFDKNYIDYNNIIYFNYHVVRFLIYYL